MDAEKALHRLADQMAGECAELTGYMVREFRDRIPELPSDPALVELLAASSGGNLESMSHLLRGHIPIDEIRAPGTAVEYARRLAQRGTAPSALLRAYRMGQALVVAWGNEQIAGHAADAEEALATSRSFIATSFQYIDLVSEEVMVAYQEERERWLTNRSAVRRQTVDALLRGDRVDVGAAETTLGYRLRQHHLGIVLWTEGADAGLADSERLLTRIADQVGTGGHALFVPRDRDTAWGWLPIGRSGDVDHEAIAEALSDVDPGVHAAVGLPEAGEEGFRTTHLGAAAAQRVALVGRHPGRVVSFADPTVRSAAVLVRDLAATRWLVNRTLGQLAVDSEQASRMRETLHAFIEDRESYVATAARMHLHKNTVKYRVDRALEARGQPIGVDRLDLELALVACKWLGPEVLRTPTSGDD